MIGMLCREQPGAPWLAQQENEQEGCDRKDPM